MLREERTDCLHARLSPAVPRALWADRAHHGVPRGLATQSPSADRRSSHSQNPTLPMTAVLQAKTPEAPNAWMAHQQIKRFFRCGEESIRRIRILFGNMLANLPQVVPDG